MDVTLDGRVAVVTGAAGGAGRAVVAELASAGARLALIGTRLERLEALASELAIPADRCLALGVDLRDAAAATRAATEIAERLGPAGVLVHLVGGWMGGIPVMETPDEAFASMLDQHLWSTLNAVRAFLPGMTAAGWGRIVAVSSPVASIPAAKVSAYAVGKAAEEALLLTLAREVAGTGVTVNVLQVRVIDTAHERDSTPPVKNAAWTTPEEIAAVVRFLCSDAARVVNGARIPLYGAG